MDDSALYTGVDNQGLGMFGNEIKNEKVEEIKNEQKRLIQEITPKLQGIIDLIDEEIAQVMSIDRFTTATTIPESDIRSELQASALYKKYLEGLKTKFALKLQEAKRNG